jgi:hypothetical protein
VYFDPIDTISILMKSLADPILQSTVSITQTMVGILVHRIYWFYSSVRALGFLLFFIFAGTGV